LNNYLKCRGNRWRWLAAAIAMGAMAIGAAAQQGTSPLPVPTAPVSVAAGAAATQTPLAGISVTGAVTTELHLTIADLKAMPRTKVTAMDEHEKKTYVFEGVTLQALLLKAGVATGESLRGRGMALCVVAGAADGYHAVFSIGELDPSIGAEQVLVADTADGAAIPAGQGPLRLVVASDKRPARWVRMVQSIEVVSMAPPPMTK